MASNTSPDKTIQKVIVWIFPGVITILGTLIYNEISGLRSDVKNLLIQQNVSAEQISGLSKRISRLEDRIFPTYVKNTSNSGEPAAPVAVKDVEFMLPDNSQRRTKTKP